MAGRLYELVRCATAVEFVNAISPTADYFRNGEWIFRGQGRDLALLPSAFRESRMRQMQSRGWDRWTYLFQARAELRLIRRFYTIADRAGLAVPEDSYDVRDVLGSIDSDRDEFVRIWPQARLLPLIALAQHHGVPTRLLDWTHSPWVAAYFAAVTALRTKATQLSDCKIVVWAFDSLMSVVVPEADDDDDVVVGRVPGAVEVVTTPYGNNRNLAAQQGVHLVYRLAQPPQAMAVIQRDPFDHALRFAHATAEEEKVLFKFVLPPTEAGALLRLLKKTGVTGATLFPGFDGVARAMEEEDLIRQK
jgi:hypothetical protein